MTCLFLLVCRVSLMQLCEVFSLCSLLSTLFPLTSSSSVFPPSFLQLILFVAEHLECNKEDCEALIHMLKTFLRQLHLDREVLTNCIYTRACILTTCAKMVSWY